MAYVFHGENPEDWHDEVFHYELRFVDPPSTEALGALGTLYARTFDGATAIVPGGWRFSDRYASFSATAC